MKYSVGDKLYCRENLKSYSFHNSNSNAYIFCFQDDFVRIVKVTKDSIQIENHKGKKTYIMESSYSIYFYTDKELRKLKLEKINVRA